MVNDVLELESDKIIARIRAELLKVENHKKQGAVQQFLNNSLSD